MKKWPKNDETASFTDLTASAVSAIKFAYELKRKNKGKSIPITGLDTPDTTIHGPSSVLLNAANLKYSEEEQGRNALVEIVSYAVRLGIEQGRRMTMQGHVVTLKAQLALQEMKVRTLEEKLKKVTRKK